MFSVGDILWKSKKQKGKNAHLIKFLIHIHVFVVLQITEFAAGSFLSQPQHLKSPYCFLCMLYNSHQENLVLNQDVFLDMIRHYILNFCFLVNLKMLGGTLRVSRVSPLGIEVFYVIVLDTLFKLIVNILCYRSICWISQTLLSRAVSCSFLSRPAWRFVLVTLCYKCFVGKCT